MSDNPPDPWAEARTAGIADMVANEADAIWADGHALMTCGSHTGHAVWAIAYCQDADWAKAIAAAIAARKDAPHAPNSDGDGR